MGKQNEKDSEKAKSNKRHNKKNLKLIAKKKYKKNKSKFMQVRKKLREVKNYKEVYRKHQLICEKFSEKVPCDEFIRIKQYIGKLIEHDP